MVCTLSVQVVKYLHLGCYNPLVNAEYDHCHKDSRAEYKIKMIIIQWPSKGYLESNRIKDPINTSNENNHKIDG